MAASGALFIMTIAILTNIIYRSLDEAAGLVRRPAG